MSTTQEKDDRFRNFSVRLRDSLLDEVEVRARRRKWSRNRTIEQALILGLPRLEETEAPQPVGGKGASR